VIHFDLCIDWVKAFLAQQMPAEAENHLKQCTQILQQFAATIPDPLQRDQYLAAQTARHLDPLRQNLAAVQS
ncbi:MAG: hypothetical protein AAF629_20605, partial [Chloroflexota bacterium]